MRIADGFSYQETKKTPVCVCGGMVRERHGTCCAAVSSSSCVVPNKNKTFKNFLEQCSLPVLSQPSCFLSN